ncbi:MAG: Flp family type IVb pilin [Bacteriovoracaceae bacterium]
MKKLLKKEDGQGVMEYIILTSLIGIFCLVAIKQFGETLQTRMEQMKKQIVKNIEIK